LEKPALGIIATPRGSPTEKHLLPVLKKKFNLVMCPLQADIEYSTLKERSRGLQIVLNTAGDMPNTYDSLEMAKTFEGLGKRVIDSSKSFYYREDKWLFYQTCVKHKLPTPITYYIPRDINASRKKLRQILEEGPVVFKGVFSDTGKAVKRAMNYEEALHVISTLHKKTGIMPLVAQRYVPHGKVSYRVTLAGGKIIQSITKYGKNWKEGKLFWKNEKYRTFRPDKKLAAICTKTAKCFGLEWCGIDLMKDSSDRWQLIEVNSCPSMDFVLSDMKRANTEIANYLLHLHNKLVKK
jgi:glutathione synthase/RimK-type ligase-like ATP-grasp enzyme